MRITVDISLYPLDSDYIPPIKGFIRRLRAFDGLELVTNQPWLILLAVTITFILFVAVRGSVTVHYFKYFVGSHELDIPFLNKGNYDFEWLSGFYNGVGQISFLL